MEGFLKGSYEAFSEFDRKTYQKHVGRPEVVESLDLSSIAGNIIIVDTIQKRFL